jgi:sulfate adenylyltransferase subunit 2
LVFDIEHLDPQVDSYLRMAEKSIHRLDDIIKEIIETKISERGATRMDDRISEAGMEDRKKSGYF